jgi:antirestriction protein
MAKQEFYTKRVIVPKEKAGQFREKLKSAGFSWDSYDESERYDNVEFGFTASQMKKIKSFINDYAVEIEEYAKGGKVKHPKVKITKGKRLPHGYEVEKAASNDDYSTRSVKVKKGHRLSHGYETEKGKRGKVYAKGGGVRGGAPKIYVADLAAYNEGKLVGEWIDLDEYSSGDEVMKAIQSLLEKWSKEAGVTREEYAIHDVENIPDSLYSEHMGEKDFDAFYEVYEAAKDSGCPLYVASQWINEGNDAASFSDAYRGEFRTFREYAEQFVDGVGIDNISNADYYFDYDAFGHDERINMGGEADEASGYGDLSDEQLGEQLVDEMGGFEELSKKTREMYFDYESFARDLNHDYNTIEHDGYVYVFEASYKRGGIVTGKKSTWGNSLLDTIFGC